MKFFTKKVIRGCEARGDADSAYMTRLALVRGRLGSICLHWFHRSDADDMHNHPFDFVSVILWRGYVEHTPAGRRRYYPGAILFRRATHIHRIELLNGKPAITFVIMRRRSEDWGFITPFGYEYWKHYFQKRGCR